MSDLFDFINSMFSKPAEFKKTTLHERGKHFFMINRFMSIKHPVKASYFNHVKINPGQVVTYWQESLSNMYKKTPGWMFVKTKKAKEEKKKKQVVTDETIRIYCAHFNLARKDVESAIKMLGEPFEEELRSFEKLITQY